MVIVLSTRGGETLRYRTAVKQIYTLYAPSSYNHYFLNAVSIFKYNRFKYEHVTSKTCKHNIENGGLYVKTCTQHVVEVCIRNVWKLMRLIQAL